MPGHLLRRCQQIAVAIFHDECESLELTPLQFAVLDSLAAGGPQDQVTLGGATALDRTTISVVIRNLEQRGLLRRDKSACDQRAKIVSISAEGRKLLASALPAVESAQRRILAPLESDEKRLLLELLEKLADGNNALSRAPEVGGRSEARSRTSTRGRGARKP
jgi:DNA-binding MarR family transcriptional regulator